MGEITKFPGKTQEEIKNSINIQELKDFLLKLDQNITTFQGILIKGKDQVFVPENCLMVCFNEDTMMPVGHKPLKARELLTLSKWCADKLKELEEQTKALEAQEKEIQKGEEDEV